MSDPSDMARRAWLQAMLTHRIVPEAQAIALWKQATTICSAPYDKRGFPDFVSEVQEHLGELGMDIGITTDQTSGHRVVAIINSSPDMAGELATSYSKLELDYIKRIIQHIFTAANATYCVNSTVALKEASNEKSSMTKTQAQDLINNLILHGWIRRTPGGRYTLSIRSLLELKPYLKEMYPEYVRECKQCTELVTIGLECPTPQCDGVVHTGVCEDQWLRKEQKCRGCKKEWRPDVVGDEDLTIEKRLNARARAGNDDGAEDSEDDEGEDEQPTQEGEEAEEHEDEDEDEEPYESRQYQTSFVANKRKRAVAPRRASGRARPRVIDDEPEEMESE